MSTTALLVEIIVVGFAFFVTIIPIISLITGINPLIVGAFLQKGSIFLQLAAAYTAGIIWNRVCDQIFHLVDRKAIRSVFSTRKDYQKARITIVLKSEPMRDYLGQYRSLIRVSRASTVLIFVYLVMIPLFFFELPTFNSLNQVSKFGLVVFTSSLLFCSYYAWFRLARGYVAAIRDAFSILEENNESSKVGKSDHK